MNWGQIKTAVQHYLETTETTFVGHLADFARLAEEDIYRQVQLQFTKQLATSVMIVGDRFIDVPPNCMSIYSFSYTSNNEFKYILPKEFSFLKEAYPSTTFRGPPRYYAYRDEAVLMLAPIPDAAYPMDLYFFEKPTSISAGADGATNWLSENGENALIFGIVLQGYIYQKGDQDVIAMYQKQFDTAIANLKLIAEGRQQKDTYRATDQRQPT